MHVDLNNKVAIVTGAGQGIGKSIALMLAREGAKVVVCDVNPDTSKQVAELIKERGGQAIAVKADVTNRVDVQRMVDTTLEQFGVIHILVNNAGIILNAPLPVMSQEDWDGVINVDLKGVFNCIQAVSATMMKQRYGKIVNMSSCAGTGTGGAGLANYASAKAGVVALTKVAARELGPYGVNVNSVAPGAIMTDLIGIRRNKEELEKFIEERERITALGRVGEPDDIANVVLFLASDEADYITGQVINADGGRFDRM